MTVGSRQNGFGKIVIPVGVKLFKVDNLNQDLTPAKSQQIRAKS